jgi:hypothetical protein
MRGPLGAVKGLTSHAPLVFWSAKSQVLSFKERGTMAKQPNYDFERRERERLKKQKNAERAEAKLKPTTESAPEASDNAADEE